MQGIKLVTFDATNTLLKFKLPPWEQYALVVKAQGFKVESADLKVQLINNMKMMSTTHPNFGRRSILWEEWWHRVIKQTLTDKLPEHANINLTADELIQVFRTSKCWSTAEGAHDIIQKLRDLGKSIGVISNFDPRLHDVLRNLELSDKLDFVLTSYEAGISKPDKQIFQLALHMCKQDIKPSESLHIGDNYIKDYIGARAAGWHSILVGDGKYEIPLASDHVFKNLIDLSLIIESNMLKF